MSVTENAPVDSPFSGARDLPCVISKSLPKNTTALLTYNIAVSLAAYGDIETILQFQSFPKQNLHARQEVAM